MNLIRQSQLLKSSIRLSYSDYWLSHLNKSNPSSSLFFYLFKPTHRQALNLNLISKEYFLYFIRKETFYTKLKYSRVPQFDTSASAVASLLSGFYGYLVCEKFGIELVDGGDFLFLALYVILLSLTVINLIKIVDGNVNISNFIVYWFRTFK
jgi:hypothetical protein